MKFNNPEYLWLLLILIPLILWYIFKQFKSDASMQISTTEPFSKMPKSHKHYLFHLLFLLRVLVVILLVVVIARPQLSNHFQTQSLFLAVLTIILA